MSARILAPLAALAAAWSGVGATAVSGPEFTPQEDVDAIYQLVKDFTDTMNEASCKYWAEGGTFLGAKRQTPGGLCKWDDDADFGMMVSDESCFTGLKKALKKKGVCTLKWYYGYKVYKCSGREVDDNPQVKFPFIDLFLVECGDDGMSYYPRTNWYKKCKWECADLDKLEDCDFGPLTVPCTSTTTYLDNCYGKSWSKEGKQGKNHASGTEGSGETFELTPKLLKPAMPSGELK